MGDEYVFEKSAYYKYKSHMEQDHRPQAIKAIGLLRDSVKIEPKTFRDVTFSLVKALSGNGHLLGSFEGVPDGKELDILKDLFDDQLIDSWKMLNCRFEPNPYKAFEFLRVVMNAFSHAGELNVEKESKRKKRFEDIQKKIDEVFSLVEEDPEILSLTKKKCAPAPPFSRQVSTSTGIDYKADMKFVFAMDDAIKGYYQNDVPSYGFALAKFRDDLFEVLDWGTITKTTTESRAKGVITPKQSAFCNHLDAWLMDNLVGNDNHLYDVQAGFASVLFKKEINGDAVLKKLKRMHT